MDSSTCNSSLCSFPPELKDRGCFRSQMVREGFGFRRVSEIGVIIDLSSCSSKRFKLNCSRQGDVSKDALVDGVAEGLDQPVLLYTRQPHLSSVLCAILIVAGQYRVLWGKYREHKENKAQEKGFEQGTQIEDLELQVDDVDIEKAKAAKLSPSEQSIAVAVPIPEPRMNGSKELTKGLATSGS